MIKLEQRIHEALKKSKKPLGTVTLAKMVNSDKSNRKEFHLALNNLISEGQIIFYNNRYGLPRHMDLVPAEIVKVTATFGFARPLEEGKDDLFVPGRNLLGSMPGDKVLIKVSRGSRGDLTEGTVVQIVEEINTPFSGTLKKDEHGHYYVEADKYVKFPLPLAKNTPIVGRVGDKVLALLRHRGERHNQHTVEIVQSFGDANRAATCAEAVLAENHIYREFPTEVQEQARAIASGVGIHPKELSIRLDLRDENIFTIDGADTKDIDDAISLVSTNHGWLLGVHIADVSYYVTRQSPLDIEAFERGTSVYFANQVVPMLPKELSNGICSLNPQEDRLAFSALIELDKQGKIQRYKFEKTAIRSRIKGVYSEINSLLEDENPSKELTKKYKDQLETLKEMEKLAEILHTNRMNRNAMDLESPESKLVIGEDGRITDIIPRVQGKSEGMIEEFMLVANEAAATFATEKKLPFVYRVHESPNPDRLETLFQLLDSLGVSYQRPKENQSPAAALDQILRSVKNTDMGGIVNYSVLRTMAKAQYRSENLGHFGLALDNYAHFTSPIRRYPDLAIHRILSSYATGMKPENIEKHYRKWVETASTQSTNREMAAMTAERTADDCYKAEYMDQFIGQEFDGVISSATGFGIFVQLPNTVEGLIRSDKFPAGRWIYDNLITYKNEVGGATLRLGDSVRIKVIGTEVASGQVDFAFAKPELYTTSDAVGSSFQIAGKSEKPKRDAGKKPNYSKKKPVRPRPKGKGDRKKKS